MNTSTAPASEAAAVDALSLWDYFQAFCEARRVSIELTSCHEEICELYEAVLTGKMPGCDYVVTNMPRRIGKTKILEATASWMEGEFPGAQIIGGAYSDPLIKRSIAYIGATMRSAFHVDLYGDRLHTLRSEMIGTIDGGCIYGAGTTGTITGFGAGLKEPAGGYIWMDDPAKPDEALSKVSSAAVIQNFETTFKGCRNSDRFCPIIINAQRLGPDDLPGYLIKNYPKETVVLKFPCFVDGRSQFPQTWRDDTAAGYERSRIGRYVLASQFQQEPISLGGNLIQVDSFQRFDLSEAPALQWEQIVITCDTALKAKELNDYSCAQAWGRLKGRAYLLDQVWGKWESPELLEVTHLFWNKIANDFTAAPVRLIIEEKAAGPGLIQQLNVLGVPAEGIERDIDKVRRVQAILPYQETGLVYIPRDTDAPWVGGFVAECGEFKPDMTHAHDDRVDCFADGVHLLLGEPLSILDVLGAEPRG